MSTNLPNPNGNLTPTDLPSISPERPARMSAHRRRGLRTTLVVLGGTLGIILLSASSCAQATQDRTGGAGNQPDQFGEAKNVRVYTNADSVPNVALFCLDGWGFASTLSGGDSGKDKAATLLRLPDLDVSYCHNQPK